MDRHTGRPRRMRCLARLATLVAALLLVTIPAGAETPVTKSAAAKGVADKAATGKAVAAKPASDKATPEKPDTVVGPTASTGPGINATDARVAGDDKRTRFVVDLTESVPISVFTLADPYRVVIDLPEVHFTLPDGTGAGRGLVSAFRYGLISAGKSRIVLDLAASALVDKAFIQPATASQPARLVVDIAPASREAFLDATKRYRDETASIPAKPDPVPARTKDGKRRIVLDPGHGGIDVGTRGLGGTLEKDVVLAFARVLADKLKATGRYEIFLTRTDDSFLRLRERVDFARQHAADLFISIHADSYRSDLSVRGAAVYTLSEKASDAMVASIAEQENKSDILAGVDSGAGDNSVADILLDLTLRETKNFSIVFARDLLQELKADMRLSRTPHQQAGFLVLKAPDTPSALIELGFLSNRDDEKLLKLPDWQDKASGSILRAIDAYFAAVLARKGAP